jgi:hypothetical protein
MTLFIRRVYPSVAVSHAENSTARRAPPRAPSTHPSGPAPRPRQQTARRSKQRRPTPQQTTHIPPLRVGVRRSPPLFPLPASPLAGDRRGGVGGAETPVAAAATMGDHEARGDDFEKKAEKKLTGWGIFGSKYEDAADLFDKAANSLKLAKNCERSWLRRSPSRLALSPIYFSLQSVRFDCRCCLQPLDLPPDRGPGSLPRCLVWRSSGAVRTGSGILGRGSTAAPPDLRCARFRLRMLASAA